jgi:hypothetical protein
MSIVPRWLRICDILATVKTPITAELASPSTVAWWKKPGVIYFIAAGEPPVAIKIGMAAITGDRDLKATISRRLSQIQSSNHELIRLLGVIHFTQGEYPTRDAEAKERELHDEFRGHCRFAEYTRGAEWFKAVPELLARIEKVATKPEALQLPITFSSVVMEG